MNLPTQRLTAALCVLLVACGKPRTQATPQGVSQADDLRALYATRLAEAASVRDQETGWLARWDCDGMIWASKYASSLGVEGVKIEAAEYPGQPGKFGRRPPPWCFTPELGDQGSKTEWSRDMAVGGLLPYAWLTANRDLLERHAAFGYQQAWWMGEPTADGRTYYTPQVRGLLFKAIRALGGSGSPEELWPTFWQAGLIDYEAHLQVMSIWLQGEVARSLNEADAVPRAAPEPTVMLAEDGEWALNDAGDMRLLEINEAMYQRLVEHAEREPTCPLYRAVLGLYTGDLAPATRELLDPVLPKCSYVRCQDGQCQLAEWLFAASIVLRKLDEGTR